MARLSDTNLSAAATIEAPRRGMLLGDSSNRLNDSARRRVALVEGSTPHMSEETRCLLRKRLRIVAVLLACGFSAFFFWLSVMSLLEGDLVISGPLFAWHV